MKHRFERIPRKERILNSKYGISVTYEEENPVIEKFFRLWMDSLFHRKRYDDKFADIIKFGSAIDTNNLVIDNRIIKRLNFDNIVIPN